MRGVLAAILDTRWDAVLSDFRRYYQLDLRKALTEMPACDLVALVKKLPSDSALVREESGAWADWDAHKENTARLLEVMAYQLELDWIDRTTDPDDPEVKRERAIAKRDGIKPSEHPIVPPVAMRPHDLAEERAEQYVELLAAQRAKTAPQPQVSNRAAFEAAWGMND